MQKKHSRSTFRGSARLLRPGLIRHCPPPPPMENPGSASVNQCFNIICVASFHTGASGILLEHTESSPSAPW